MDKVFAFGLQAGDDPLDRERAFYLLRSLGSAGAAPPPANPLQLDESLDELSLHGLEVTAQGSCPCIQAYDHNCDQASRRKVLSK